MMVLSGISDMVQMQDNISYMKDFHSLSGKEPEAVGRVQEIFCSVNLILCMSCRHCEAGCSESL